MEKNKLVLEEGIDGVKISGNVNGCLNAILSFYVDAYVALDKLLRVLAKNTAMLGKAELVEAYYFDLIEKHRQGKG